MLFSPLVGLAKRGPRHNGCCGGESGLPTSPLCRPAASDATVVQQANRKRKKERTVDALALGGDEGRGKLR